MDSAVLEFRSWKLIDGLLDAIYGLDEPNADPLLYRPLYQIPLDTVFDNSFWPAWREEILLMVLKEAEVSEAELSLWHNNFVTAEKLLLTQTH